MRAALRGGVCVGLTGCWRIWAAMSGTASPPAHADSAPCCCPACAGAAAAAWLAWLARAAALAWLGLRGHGGLALDAVPVLINLALCGVFARTLRHGASR